MAGPRRRQVTLVDQFEPGDPRASSGGESRLLRSAHGPHADYTASARRARTLWRELEAESGEELYLECGLTWFAQRDDAWEAQSIPVLAAQGIPHQRLSPDDGALLFPTWDPSGLRFLLHEPEAGVVRAQRAVQTLVRRAAAHGATCCASRATPDGAAARLEGGRDAGRRRHRLGLRRRGCPSCSPSTCPCGRCSPSCSSSTAARGWRDPSVPAFVDLDSAFYGTHDLDGLGVKMAPDFDGPAARRRRAAAAEAGEARLDVTRKALESRFPRSPRRRSLHSKTCRYEPSIDSHFIAAEHPEQRGVWLLGGGSGHGFKHGPAMAERLAPALRGEAVLPGSPRAGRARRERRALPDPGRLLTRGPAPG